MVEVSWANMNEWKVIFDVASAIDAILEGLEFPCQIRTRDAGGQC